MNIEELSHITEENRHMINENQKILIETRDTIIQIKTVLLDINGHEGLLHTVNNLDKRLDICEGKHTKLLIAFCALLGVLIGLGLLTADIFGVIPTP